MSDYEFRSSNSTNHTSSEGLARLVQNLVDRTAEAQATWERIERQAIPLLERIALALERGATIDHSSAPVPSGAVSSFGETSNDRSAAAEVRAAIDDRRWDRAQAILDGYSSQSAIDPKVAESLAIELTRSRDRAVAEWRERIDAARLANDAEGALNARDELAKILDGPDLKEVDRSMVAWLMKLIQRRLRTVPVGSDLAALATLVADRFGGTPEGASLRAALPTLRRSAGLCPRCSEAYLGVDDACPKCLAAAGQAATPALTLTFASEDDLDVVVQDAPPVDLNNAEIWRLP